MVLDEERAKRVQGLVHNEQVKLFASLLNAMAGSSYAIGVAAPIAATFFYSASPLRLQIWTVLIGVVVWLAIAMVLHLLAFRVLGRLRE